jgi:chromosome segregation ATPase
MKESQAALRESKDRLQKADNDAHMLRSDLETAQKRLEDAIQNVDATETSLESKYRQEIGKRELQAKTLQRELLDSKNETENALESASRAKTQLTDAKEKFAKAVSKGKGFQGVLGFIFRIEEFSLERLRLKLAFPNLLSIFRLQGSFRRIYVLNGIFEAFLSGFEIRT